MNLFDKLVTEALKKKPELSLLRPVIEKELLHHDILRILSQQDLLKNLTFIGGTCLRCCYGGVRLSEDLDFTGGSNFSRDSLATMGQILVENLHHKYGLFIEVGEPQKDEQSVTTWKIKIETKPKTNHLPQQRIHIDICAIPSYEKIPMLIINHYGVDMGTSGLIIQAQSREEIYTDKLIAFALRNRIQYRDIWDITWLHGQGFKPRLELLTQKLKDRQCTVEDFIRIYHERVCLLKDDEEAPLAFRKEMMRFLPMENNDFLNRIHFWTFIVSLLLDDLGEQIKRTLMSE